MSAPNQDDSMRTVHIQVRLTLKLDSICLARPTILLNGILHAILLGQTISQKLASDQLSLLHTCRSHKTKFTLTSYLSMLLHTPLVHAIQYFLRLVDYHIGTLHNPDY